jgi:hypothetical protein
MPAFKDPSRNGPKQPECPRTRTSLVIVLNRDKSTQGRQMLAALARPYPATRTVLLGS